MAVNKELIKTLREKSGCGMMECKHALVEAGNDIEKAQELLRKKGKAQAIKKGDRTTNDGLVNTLLDGKGKSGILLELDCETDFVAKTDDFKNMVKNITEKLSALKEVKDTDGIPEDIKSIVVDGVGKLRENMKLSKFVRFDAQSSNGLITSYIHPGSKLGVLIEVESDKEGIGGNEEVLSVIKDITMQIAAMNPSWVKNDDIPKDVLQKEKEIYMQQAKDSGKPEKILDQIAAGRLKKFYKQTCLLDQEFIKDSKLTVGKVLEEAAGKMEAKIEVRRFARFKVGEE